MLLVVPRFEHRIPLQFLFAGSVGAFGAALLGFASVDTYWVASIFAMLAGACIATLTVAANTYIVKTTEDEIRGRVFTAMEAVAKVALLVSMVVMAPLADFIGGLVEDFVVKNNLTPATVELTGSRITLQLCALMVMGAAIYGFRALRWRECAADASIPAPPPVAEAAE